MQSAGRSSLANEDSRHGGKQRPALETTGAIGNVIGRERLAERSNSASCSGSTCAAETKGNAQRPTAASWPRESRRVLGITHLAVMPSRFQARRVREAPGRERRNRPVAREANLATRPLKRPTRSARRGRALFGRSAPERSGGIQARMMRSMDPGSAEFCWFDSSPNSGSAI